MENRQENLRNQPLHAQRQSGHDVGNAPIKLRLLCPAQKYEYRLERKAHTLLTKCNSKR